MRVANEQELISAQNGADDEHADDDAVAVAERPAETGQAVEDAPVQQKVREESKPKRQPRYQVILWDDDAHTYQYVTLMMIKLFAHPLEKAIEIAKTVDTSGRAIVLTTTREHAELKRDQIHAFGKDDLIADCSGSMWSTIEPIE